MAIYDINSALRPYSFAQSAVAGLQTASGIQQLQDLASKRRSTMALARAMRGDAGAMADIDDPALLTQAQQFQRQQGLRGFFNPVDQNVVGINSLETLANAKPRGFDVQGAVDYMVSQGAGADEISPLLELAELRTPKAESYGNTLEHGIDEQGNLVFLQPGGPTGARPVAGYRPPPQKPTVSSDRLITYGPGGQVAGVESLPMTPQEQARTRADQERLAMERDRLRMEIERRDREMLANQPVTADPKAPWSRVPPKDQPAMQKRVYDQAQKQLDDLRSAVSRGRNMVQLVNRFGELNRQVGTGGVLDVIPTPTMSSAKQEMESISARLTPGQREPGSGSSSDMDIKMFARGVPSVERRGDVNQKIREQIIATQQEYENRLRVMESFLQDRGYLPSEQQTSQLMKIPEKSKAALISNPQLRGQFDAKYGRGASSLILGD